jgi:hypothetical protein
MNHARARQALLLAVREARWCVRPPGARRSKPEVAERVSAGRKRRAVAVEVEVGFEQVQIDRTPPHRSALDGL